MNCDEYYSYNALAGLVKSNDDEPAKKWDPWELVTEAVSRMKRNGDVMRSDRLKQVMQEIDSSFDEKDLGMAKFSRFVQDAVQRGLLSATKLENGQLEIGLPERRQGRGARRGERRRRRRRARRGRRPSPADERSVEGGAAVADVVAAAAIAMIVRAPTRRRAAARRRAPRARGCRAEPRHRRRHPRHGGRTRGRRASARTPRDRDRGTAPRAGPAAPSARRRSVQRRADRRHRRAAHARRGVRSRAPRRSPRSPRATTAVRAGVVRAKARELLGRDSESLSDRNFPRILKDAHDSDVIDLRRRGDDFEIARAVGRRSPCADQLREDGDRTMRPRRCRCAAAPRGMGPRGVGGPRGRARRPGAPPPTC